MQGLAGELAPPLGGEGVDAADIGVIDRDLLRLGAVVGHRPDQADLRPIVQAAGNQPVEPVGGNDGVVIE